MVLRQSAEAPWGRRAVRLHSEAMGLLARVVVLICCAACSSTPGLELIVSPTPIPGDGATPFSIQVKLTKGGGAVEGSVHIAISAGRFKDPTGSDPVAQDVQTSSDGPTTVAIVPPRKGRGTLDITVTATLDGATLKKTGQIMLTPAGGLASSLTFTCEKQNVGALVPGRTDAVHVLCNAVASDASGRPIKDASIEPMAEAGRLEWLTDETGVQRLVYTVDPGATPPRDVLPVIDSAGKTGECPSACIADPRGTGCVEPCWIGGGRTRNPRDGLATLAVAVPGVKAFDDKGEPFVDEDDDGERTVTEARYIDYNNNGKYDKGDGSQKERMIWRAVRIIWSGAADTSAFPYGSQFKATVNSLNATVSLRLNDQNMNTLAADGLAGADQISFSANCAQGHTLTLPSGVAMQQVKPGIKLRADTGEIDGPGFATTYLDGSDYSFNATIDEKPDQCTVDATISRTYDPGAAPLFSSNGELGTEKVTGSINF